MANGIKPESSQIGNLLHPEIVGIVEVFFFLRNRLVEIRKGHELVVFKLKSVAEVSTSQSRAEAEFKEGNSL